MGIGGITSANSMPAMQITASDLKDQKSKSLQNKIDDVQQQIQKLSSEEELSAIQKADEQKKLQKEKSDLTTQLRQHQEQLRKSQKKEIKSAALQEDMRSSEEDPAEGRVQSTDTASNDTANKELPSGERQTLQPGTIISQSADGVVILKGFTDQDTAGAITAESKQAEATPAAFEETGEDSTGDDGQSFREMQAMVSADSSLQQIDRLGNVIAKTDDDIAVLRGEIKQDEKRGIDAERKQAELDDMQKQNRRALAFQFSQLGDVNNPMNAAAEPNEAINDGMQDTSLQSFYVSIT